MSVRIHTASIDELSPRTLYDILRLRADVFVVEQRCAFPELDGRDLEAGTRILWAENARGELLGTLRLLAEEDGCVQISRVTTNAAARGLGIGGRLVVAALEQLSEAPAIVLNAQSRLEPWYGGFGFQRDGEDFLEDDILHVPMRRLRPDTTGAESHASALTAE